MLNAIPNKRLRPLYRDAVYGIRNTKHITDAAILSASLVNLLPKKSGIVALERY